MAMILHISDIAQRLGVKPRSLAAYLSGNRRHGAPAAVRRGFYDFEAVQAFRNRKRSDGIHARREWWRDAMAKVHGNDVDPRANESELVSTAARVTDGQSVGKPEALAAAGGGHSVEATSTAIDAPQAQQEAAGAGSHAPTTSAVEQLVALLVESSSAIIAEEGAREESVRVGSSSRSAGGAPSPESRATPAAESLAQKGDTSATRVASRRTRQPQATDEHELSAKELADESRSAGDDRLIAQNVAADTSATGIRQWLSGAAVVTGGVLATVAAVKLMNTVDKLRRLDELVRRTNLDVTIRWRTLPDLGAIVQALIAGRDPVKEAELKVATAVHERLTSKAASDNAVADRLLARLRSTRLLAAAPAENAASPGGASIIANPAAPTDSPAVLR